MNIEDCYKILKINSDASQNDIQKAFDVAIKEKLDKRSSFQLFRKDRNDIQKILIAYKILKGKDFTSPSINSFLREKRNGKGHFLKGISKNFKNKEKRMKKGIKSGELFGKKIEEQFVVHFDPESIASEQYRVLFSQISKLFKDGKNKRIAITSSIMGEGKSTTCLNLGTIITKDFNKKTLMIDGDLKKPDLHRFLISPNRKGLVDILAKYKSLQDCIYPFFYENLFLMPAGSVEKNSTRLLSLPKMKEILSSTEKEFDFVIIDSPPVLPIADMNIFSELVDGILFVVRAGVTPRDLVKKALDRIPSDKILGIVLNGMESGITKYYGYPY